MEASSAPHSKSSPGSTPRASVDGQTLSSSPRFQSLHRRFRSSSTTTSINSDILPTKEPGSPVKKTDALKSVKRFLLSKVRNDWTYPAEGVSDILNEIHLESRDPGDYLTRIDASSEFESDGPARKRGSAARARNNENDPYKFDSPDAVGTSLADRKAKKRKLFEEEQSWNSGLKIWAQRRDAWTGAVNIRPWKRKSQGSAVELNIAGGRRGSSLTDTSTEWPLPPASPQFEPKAASSSTDPVGPWLPVFPPLLPEDNPIRANIKPVAYPTIYSKVVIQNLTPTVPIPLNHMTCALVQGWKADGAWPPQSGLPAAAVITEGGKKTSAILKFRRQRLNGEKGRVRKSLGAVKKALVGESPPQKPVDDPVIDMDFEEQLDAEAADNTELNKGLLES